MSKFSTKPALLLFFCLFCFQFAKAAPETIVVGYFDLPPHGTSLAGKPHGIALDYFKMISREMGVKVQFIQRPLPRLLVDQDIDLILYLGKTEEREKKLVFSKSSLYKMQGTLTTRNESPLRTIDSQEDVNNLKIAVWQDGYISPLIRNSKANLSRMTGDQVADRALKQVANGRLDGFYSPDPFTVFEEIKKLGLKKKLKVVNLSEPPVDLSPAFTKAGAAKFYTSFEAAIAKTQKRIEYIQYLRSRLK